MLLPPMPTKNHDNSNNKKLLYTLKFELFSTKLILRLKYRRVQSRVFAWIVHTRPKYYYQLRFSPLQGSTLHSSQSSLPGPGQYIPPYLVSGSEHFRVRVKFPLPHGRLQSLYFVHWLQAPSTNEHDKGNLTRCKFHQCNSEYQLIILIVIIIIIIIIIIITFQRKFDLFDSMKSL